MTSILNMGPEGVVPTFVAKNQLNASVAALADGGYIVVWEDPFQLGVFGQRYDAAGHKVGTATQLNQSTTSGHTAPHVVGTGDGGFTVTWDIAAHDTTPATVGIRHFDAQGSANDGEIYLDETATANRVGYTNDRTAFVWSADTGSGYDIHIMCFDDNGDSGSETLVNTTTAGSQLADNVTGLAGGAFVVTWSSTDVSGTGVYSRLFDGEGNPLGDETLVNTYTNDNQYESATAALADGGYVVTWTSANQDGHALGVYAQRFDASGARVGGEFHVSRTTADSEAAPQIAALSDGGFAISWQGAGAGGAMDIYVQRYDADAQPVGAEVRVNTDLTHTHQAVDIAGLGDGGFVVTWASLEQDGWGSGIYQKAFTSATSLVGTQYLYGTGDADDLDGGSGNDIMSGGYGDDVYHVNAAGDVISEAADQGHDTVMAAITYTLADNLEDLTLTGSSPINGTGNELDNIITGNAAANVLDGAGGNDTIDGSRGADIIHGGSGFDDLYGGDGNDFIDFTGASDVDGGAGNDVIFGGAIGVLYGGDGNDQITGGTGDDTIDGGTGDDFISTGGGTNHVSGGAGEDVITGQGQMDYVNGGEGIDTYSADLRLGPIAIDLSAGTLRIFGSIAGYLTGIENATGSAYADTLIGDGGANILQGGGDNDVLNGGAGDDQLMGGAGNDTASYASATAGVTVSLLLAHTWQDTGSAGLDYFDSIESLTGSKYNDTLTGDSGNNQLDGGAGADVMKGGLGDDTYVVGNAYDNVGERLNEGTDTVLSSITYTLPSNVENLTLTGTANLNATGNSDNNTIYGNSGNNLIDGGAGADKMYGGLGDDTYVVNNGFDQANENANEGTDTVQSSITFTIGNNVENLTLTGVTAINGTGNALNNILTGNSGNNVLKGGAGNDTFVFGKFGVANGLDHLADFVTGADHLSFKGSDYGIAAGHHLTNAELSTTGSATSAAGVGQFVYNTTTHTLSWDANGVTVGGMTSIVVFDNAIAPVAGDFIFT